MSRRRKITQHYQCLGVTQVLVHIEAMGQDGFQI